MAIAGLVLSILGLVLSFFGTWFSIVALPVAVVGLVVSCIARKKQPGGVATAGMVIGIIAVVFATIFFFTCGICTICAAAALEKAASGYESELNELANALQGLS